MVAAGNAGNSSQLTFPASMKLSNMISVGSLNGQTLAKYSCVGADIAAPGNLVVLSANNQYAKAEGTSFSVPQVALSAALLWQKYPKLTAPQLRQKVLDAADIDPVLDGKVLGSRRFNFAKVVEQ